MVPLTKEVTDLSGFSDPDTFYPGLRILTGLTVKPKTSVWLDHRNRIISSATALSNSSSGRIDLKIEKNCKETGIDIQDVSGFRKITHLLDPVRWLQGRYDPEKIKEKLDDPMNQAYVEALAAYSLGKLKEEDASPHFHAFYGAFSVTADRYAYNISDSYMSFRHCRWFWDNQKNGIFKLAFDDSLPADVKEAILDVPDDLSDDESDAETEKTEELLDDFNRAHEKEVSNSIHSLSDDDIHTESDEESGNNQEEDDDDKSESEDDEVNLFAEIKDFPVMMIFTESSEDTMDELLDDYEELGCEPGSEEWDATWTAWIFQIISALTVAQRIFGLTHNDLHSNNIVWSKTDKEFLYYKTNDGLLFKVPTYGKIFKIIDFGRSIFKLNENLFYSDDFRVGNDAGDQYSFGDLYDSDSGAEEVGPNPSFDLSRFTVSVFESLFPETPPKRKNGVVLSKERGLIVKETESDLYNLLWTWLLCDDDHNVLIDPNGGERYPDFDLYKVIAAQVHNAIPSEQIRKPIFESFRVSTASANQKVYSLFV